MPAITSLCLIDSSIKNIEDIRFNDGLETVSLHYNQISNLGRNLFPPSLTSLDLSSNCLTSLRGIRLLQKLAYLYLGANLLRDVRDFKYLT